MYYSVLCLLLATTAIVSSEQICNCIPDQPCWPTPSEWNEFNQSVSGRLIQPRPAASPCHDPFYDEAACESAKANWTVAYWRGDQIGASQHALWDAYHQEDCLITSPRNATCFQGSVPLYSVEVQQPSDVSKAFLFALRHRIRLIVKNTGHDYLGRSNGRYSLGLWTHHLKWMRFDDSFVPDGCDPESVDAVSAVTAGAGVQWGELYKAAHEVGKAVAGGFSATVGASGGYSQGGGHSVMAPTFGLPADNVLQFEVVTPDGLYQVVNRCQNPELFWALRGGGGGTFGVVLSTTHKTHPQPTVISGQLNVISDGQNSLTDFLEQFARLQPSLSDAGWGGSFTGLPNNIFINYMRPNGELNESINLMKPLVDFVESHPGLSVDQTFTPYPSFYEFFRSILCQVFPGTCTDYTGYSEVLASRLITRDYFELAPRALAEAIAEVLYRDTRNGTGALNYMLTMSVGGGAGAQSGEPDSAALNPVWRNTLWHCISEATLDDDATEEAKQFKLEDVSAANAIMRKLAPDTGSYFNEADVNEPDWQDSFFGVHYPRLLRLKRAVDPNHLLSCHQCVGSEVWDEDFVCRTV